MRIIQCAKCGKRFRVRDTDSGEATLKYKCNACYNIIVIAGTANKQGPAHLQVAEKELLSTKSVDEAILSPEHESPGKNETFNFFMHHHSDLFYIGLQVAKRC